MFLFLERFFGEGLGLNTRSLDNDVNVRASWGSRAEIHPFLGIWVCEVVDVVSLVVFEGAGSGAILEGVGRGGGVAGHCGFLTYIAS